jgi:hypothetical protein
MSITPAELRRIMDILSRANLTVAEAYQTHATLETLVQLARGTLSIGAIAVQTPVDVPSGKEG